MEPFENNEYPSEPDVRQPEAESPVPPRNEEPTQEEPITPPQPEPYTQPEYGAYHGTGTGRRESPYANSPYVRNPQQSYQEYQYQPQTQPPQKPEKPKKEAKLRKPIWKGVLAILLAAALVAGGCLITGYCVNEYWEERTEDMEEQLISRIENLQEQIDDTAPSYGSAAIPLPTDGSALTPSQLYASCVDSVVSISSTVQTTGYYGPSEGSSSGSGFILTEDGYVVTNYHVVEGASSVDVILHNDTEYPAEVVGFDATNDIAVLKVEASGLPAAALGSSAALSIGDMVAAIGNPLGELASTQTIGYVSGINREITTDNTIISMIQTDAVINPGNSGGPLFNMYGQVIGITTAKYSGTSSSGASIEGIGFAIPIDDVQDIFEDLMTYGYVTSGYLGVSVYSVDVETAAMYNFPLGCLVESVTPGSCAAKAGVQAKDIIIGLGEYKVEGYTDLARALRKFEGGDTTTVTVYRSGRELKLDITLDEKPIEQTVQIPGEKSDMPENGTYEDWYKYFFGNK